MYPGAPCNVFWM